MEKVTAAQAAVLTGFSERTIRRKIACGDLPARRIAPNRFAIDVCDLPRRWDDADLGRRLDALDHRVRLLEDGQRALRRQLDAVASVLQVGTASVQAVPTSETPEDQEPAEATISTLHDLLIELAHETDRLGPLLAPSDPRAKRQGRASGG
jgi:hypothetical protein